VRIVGVIDLRGGLAVHARGGRREHYAPVSTVAGATIAAGDAVDLAHAYVDVLGIGELYVADLDAIEGSVTPSIHADVVTRIAHIGVPLWLDAGIWSPAHAAEALATGATHVVVGLETLPSWGALADICRHVGPAHTVFSLDLRNGIPIAPPNLRLAPMHAADQENGRGADSILPEAVAVRAAEAGAASLIVLDLARVGSGMGPDVALVSRIARVAPGLELFAGGGVRSAEDLGSLAGAGCAGALVGTALQDGRLRAAGVAAARRRP